MNKKFFTALIILTLIFAVKTCLSAKSSLKACIDRVIEQNSLSKTAVVSVSVREAETGKLVYTRDENLLLHTASTLKAFTTPVMLKYLGADNQISTGLYRADNDYYLKLSGDPLLTREDLFKMFENLKKSGIKSLFIDDTAIDNIPWGIGWMWDDENNPYMPKYNAFNLDGNVVKVTVVPVGEYVKPDVVVTPDYPVKIVNNAVSFGEKELTVERRPWLDPEAIYISGKVLKPVEKIIPVGSPENYFIYNLKQAIKQSGISFNGEIKKGKVPPQAVLVEQISHGVVEEVAYINQKSVNFAAETLFKLAAREYSGHTGTTKDAIKVFKEYYGNLGADTSQLLIVDGSGVSHNNLVQTGWMSLALSKLYNQPDFEIYKKTLAEPGLESTLKKRLPGLSGKLWAKTGTLAGISGLTGYLEIKKGKTYTFAILVQNFKGNSAPAKKLEDKIIKTLDAF